MATKTERDQQYRSKWINIQNYLYNNTGYRFAGIARAGSRKQGEWSLDSDLDIRFAISSDPERITIYPDLKTKLIEGFPNASVKIGSSYNVINMKIGPLDFDLILLKIKQFQKQVKSDKIVRLEY